MSTQDSQTAIMNRHDFDKSFTVTIDTQQTAKALLTPTAGKSLRITAYMMTTTGTTGNIRLYFATANDTVGKLYAPTAPATGYVCVVINGAKNEPLLITSSVGPDKETYILINYKEY